MSECVCVCVCARVCTSFIAAVPGQCVGAGAHEAVELLVKGVVVGVP